MSVDRPPTKANANEPGSLSREPIRAALTRSLRDLPDVVLKSETPHPAAERFHKLKATIASDPVRHRQVLVITSAAPAEGKSLVAMNLALAFAADERSRVLLVDADARAPRISKFIQDPPREGLMEVLSGSAKLESVLVRVASSSLSILIAGVPTRNPVPLLSSESCRSLITLLRQRYDRIIIDTPPAVPFADANIMAPHSDGSLIVVRSGSTPRQLVLSAQQAMSSNEVVGIVLNDLEFNLADRRHLYDHDYYEYYRDPDKRTT